MRNLRVEPEKVTSYTFILPRCSREKWTIQSAFGFKRKRDLHTRGYLILKKLALSVIFKLLTTFLKDTSFGFHMEVTLKCVL